MLPKPYLFQIADEAAGIGGAKVGGMKEHDGGFIEGDDREGVEGSGVA